MNPSCFRGLTHVTKVAPLLLILVDKIGTVNFTFDLKLQVIKFILIYLPLRLIYLKNIAHPEPVRTSPFGQSDFTPFLGWQQGLELRHN